jgi:hypothetical protein
MLLDLHMLDRRLGCVAAAGLAGATLYARTGAVNMVTAISAAATFLSITIS